MNQPQSVLRSAFQCHPSKDTGNCSAPETTWGPARRRGPTNPQGETAHPAAARSPLRLTHSQPVPTQGVEQPAPPPSPGAVVKVTGRHEGASECPLGSREEGAPTRIYPPPSVESLKTVFTAQLVAINYSRPCFPLTHRLSLLARSFLDSSQKPSSRLSGSPLFISSLPHRPPQSLATTTHLDTGQRDGGGRPLGAQSPGAA